MDAGSLLASARLSALLRFAAVVVSGCLGVQGSLRDLHGLGARGGASGMVPAGCGRERTLHPLRLLERNVPAVRGRSGEPRLPRTWIAEMADTLAMGYRGIFVDDVNMLLRVGDGAGRAVAPMDPRTGAEM